MTQRRQKSEEVAHRDPPSDASSRPLSMDRANPEDEKVKLTGGLLLWGILALVVGVASGFIMSSATFLK